MLTLYMVHKEVIHLLTLYMVHKEVIYPVNSTWFTRK